MRASSFRSGDIYRNQGRNTVEAANQGMATREAATPTPSALGSANSNAPMSGSPAAIIVVLILVFVALRIVAARAGEGEHYETVAPSFYNIMVITLAGMLGGTLLKALAVKALPENNALRKFVIQG